MTAAEDKLLFVDDDAHFLAYIRRALAGRYDLVTASSPAEGLSLLGAEGPFPIVVSDLDMGAVGGIDFLHAVKGRSPDSVRLILTGNAEIHTAIALVNQANIFRFLTKPVALDVLLKALADALGQYRLMVTERDVLSRTLAGAVKVLAEILSIVDPETFDRAIALRNTARNLAVELNLKATWDIEIAAMLSRIGYVTIPPAIIRKVHSESSLSPAEQSQIRRVPQIGRDLLAIIPRCEAVAEIILYQTKNFDGSGFPEDAVAFESIPLGARILRVVTDLGDLICKGMPMKAAFTILRQREGSYDPAILTAAERSFAEQNGVNGGFSDALRVRDLQPGQCLVSNVETTDGMLLLPSGNVLSQAALEKIRNFQGVSGIKEPILVKRAA